MTTSVVVLLSLSVLVGTPEFAASPSPTAVQQPEDGVRLAKKKRRKRRKRRRSKKSKTKKPVEKPTGDETNPAGGEAGPAATVAPPDDVQSAPDAPAETAVVPAAPPPPRRIAVFPVRVGALQLNDVQRVNQTIRASAAANKTLAVQEEKLTTELLESSQDLGVDCDLNAVECAIGLGEIADVELVLLGAAGGIDEGIGIDLRLVDVTEKKVVRRVGTLLMGDRDAQNAATQQTVEHLFGVEESLGSFSLTSSPEGADVVVDGIKRGVTPLPGPVEGLWPGSHVIEVRLKGHLPDRRTIPLPGGQPQTLDVTLLVDPNAEVEVLVEREASWVEVTVPWAIASGGAVVMLGGGAAMGAGAVPWTAYQLEAATLRGNDQTRSDFANVSAVGWERADGWAQQWNSWGRLSFFIGSAVGTVGLLTAAAGGVWGTAVLLFGGGEVAPEGAGSDPEAASLE